MDNFSQNLTNNSGISSSNETPVSEAKTIKKCKANSDCTQK